MLKAKLTETENLNSYKKKIDEFITVLGAIK